MDNHHKIPVMTYVVILAVLAVSFLPAYILFYSHPRIDRELAAQTEASSVRIARDLSLSFQSNPSGFVDTTVTARLQSDIREHMDSYDIGKVRLFSPQGEIVYSSVAEEIGAVTDKDYFFQVVARGRTFSKTVRKNEPTMDGEIVSRDVVEIYVPILEGGAFRGAFEFYFDVSARMAEIRHFRTHSNVALAASTLLLAVVVGVLLFLVRHNVSRRIRIEEESRDRAQRLASLLSAATDAIVLIDDRGTVMSWNPAAERIFGYSRGEILGKNISSLVPPELRERHRRGLERFRDKGTLTIGDAPVELTGMKKDVSVFPMEMSLARIVHKGRHYVQGIIRDITVRKGLEDQLREREELYRRIFQSAGHLIVSISEDLTIHDLNREAKAFLGGNDTDAFSRSFVQTFFHPGIHTLVESDIRAVFDGNPLLDYDAPGPSEDRDSRTLLWTINVLTGTPGRPRRLIAVGQDITDRKRMEARLKDMSLKDELTGLYNRRGLYSLMEPLMKLAFRDHGSTCILYADLDHFKEINDTYGHDQGDRALVAFADILRTTYRSSDIVARLGGDEFVVFPIRVGDADGSAAKERLLANVAEANRGSDLPFELSVSVGISPVDAGGSYSVDDLLRSADEAMYAEKTRRRAARNAIAVA